MKARRKVAAFIVMMIVAAVVALIGSLYVALWAEAPTAASIVTVVGVLVAGEIWYSSGAGE